MKKTVPDLIALFSDGAAHNVLLSFTDRIKTEQEAERYLNSTQKERISCVGYFKVYNIKCDVRQVTIEYEECDGGRAQKCYLRKKIKFIYCDGNEYELTHLNLEEILISEIERYTRGRLGERFGSNSEIGNGILKELTEIANMAGVDIPYTPQHFEYKEF